MLPPGGHQHDVDEQYNGHTSQKSVHDVVSTIHHTITPFDLIRVTFFRSPTTQHPKEPNVTMSDLFNGAIMTIFAREILEATVIIGQYRTVLLRR
jgi:hypothetical protein